jgi:hypothetical protein
MNGNNSRFTIVSLYLISAILAFTMIIEAVYITPALAQTTGRYTEISRTINIPKNIPNSSSSSGGGDSSGLPNGNASLPDGISDGILISPVVNRYQQGSLTFI